MIRLQYTLTLAVPPDEVWQIVGDLAGVSQWVPGVTQATVEGNQRVCCFANGATQHEVISEYDPDQRSYRYAILDGPLPLQRNQGTWHVEANGSGSQVQWEAEIEVLDAAQEEAIQMMLDGAYTQALESLRRTITTHTTPSP